MAAVNFILYLPTFASLLWFFWIMLLRHKTARQIGVMILDLVAAIYFGIDASLMMGSLDLKYIMVFDMIVKCSALCLPPLMLIFANRFLKHRAPKAIINILFALAAIEVVAALTVNAAAGFKKMTEGPLYEGQRYLSTYASPLILTLGAGILLGYIVRFFFNGMTKDDIIEDGENIVDTKGYATMNLVSIVIIATAVIARLLVGRDFLIDHYLVSCLLSLTITVGIVFIGILGTMAVDPKNRISSYMTDFEKENKKDFKEVIAKGQDSSATVQPANLPLEKQAMFGGTFGRLLTEFNKYFEKERPYLNPDLTIDTVADALHTNRTYISVLVNQAYGVSFRDYINNLRLKEAKKQMKADPGAILELVAANSGFTSASQLTRKFKEVENCTPRTWQLSGKD